MEGYWWNRSKEWAARNRGREYDRYDFATRYLVGFSPLPAFRHLSPEDYQDKVGQLIHEIEKEGEIQRDGNPVAGTERILSQNPHEPPTRRTKRSTKPMFHAVSKQTREELRRELASYLAQYCEASVAFRGGNLKAAGWFPEGCYPPALSYIGPLSPPRPPSPPTRRITVLESGCVERGNIPVVEISATPQAQLGARQASQAVEPRGRGQPP